MSVEIVVPVALFAALFGTVAIVMMFRHRTRREMQLTVRAAIESGQALSPEILEGLTAALQPAPEADLRRGLVGLGLSLAFAVLAFTVGEPEAQGPILGLAAFPFFVGLAYLVIWRMNRNQPRVGMKTS